MKPKIKHRLKAAFMVAFSLLALTLTSLTASAWTGIGAGDVNGARFTYDNTPYGYFTGSDQFAWRVNLYVSANADGKINKDADEVGGTALPLVGSLLCIGDKWVTATVGDTYIQTNYTDNSREPLYTEGVFADSNSEDIGGVKYALPIMQEFNQADMYYDSYPSKGNKYTVAIADSGKIPLFKGQYNTELNFTTISNNLTGDEAGEYTVDILNQLIIKNEDFINEALPDAINDSIRESMVQRAKSDPDTPTLEKAINKYLLPYNPVDPTKSEPMVEWAMVITPLYRFDCKVPFYCYDIYGGDQQFGSPSANVNAALDAYWFAQYNETSKALSKAGYFPGNYTKQDGTIGSIANSSIGMLAFWLDNSAGKAANAAYCLENVDRYLGVYTNVNNNTTIDRWASLLKTTPYGPSEYAKRGGIAVFTTKIEDSPAPVYYHTYTYRIDENDKDSLPSGYTKGTYSTDDPSLLNFLNELGTPTVTVTKGTLPEGNTFYPKKGAEDLGLNGLVVAAVSPQPTLNPQPGNQDEYPILFTTDTYLERVLDSTDAQLNPTNPLADTATLKTGKATPDNTADDPKEFHVKIVHIEVIPEVPTVTTPSLRDRIKSYDVTQLIEDTKQTIEAAKGRYGGNMHINLLSTYKKDDYGEYNKSTFESIKHTGTGTAKDYKALAVIHSNDQSKSDKNLNIVALNWYNTSEEACSKSCTKYVYRGHYNSCYTKKDTDGDGIKDTDVLTCGSSHHHTSCSWECHITQNIIVENKEHQVEPEFSSDNKKKKAAASKDTAAQFIA